jgi:Transglutaminase-like superfamily
VTRRRPSRVVHSLSLVLGLLVALALPAHAAGPVEHVYFEPDPSEDLALHATTSDGRMPAAIETPSGVVSAPDPGRSPASSEPAYGGSSTPESVDATYRIDRNTSRPDLVSYDDPFIPAVTPFKRLYAYDMVDPTLELAVADKNLVRLPVGGSVRNGDDQFYGDMVVDLGEDAPVRIPSVGPGARVLSANTTPATTFQLFHDGADNWFIRASERKRVRLILELAIPRQAFGSPFADVTWAALARRVPLLPEAIRPVAERVLERIGVSKNESPAHAVSTLVSYFRGFAPSDQRPSSTGTALYEELVLSKKGVCRHRAYAFLITAHALGIPTRMVRNEAHAWVEVDDGQIWHRVDLGGAAERLDTSQDANQPMHSPPADPYSWPAGGQSAQDLVRGLLAPGGGTSRSNPSAQDGGAGDGGIVNVPGGTLGLLDGGVPNQQDDSRPAATVELNAPSGQVRRGEPLAVAGRITADSQGCRGVRVDFKLRAASGRLIPIQSLSAGDDGHFGGAIVVPLNLEVGEYDLVVSTPGDLRCGAGSIE